MIIVSNRGAEWLICAHTGSPGTGRRFDSIWVTGHLVVQHIAHLYDEAIAAGSDHAIVVADLADA
jgi:hypothetical protein